MKLSVTDLLLLLLYALVCLGIGFWSSRKKSDSDFLIAGRSLNLFGFTSSVVASYIGGAAIVAYSAYVYEFGISAIAVFLGTAAGFLIFIPYALKLREFSGEKQFITLSDWFYFKYGKEAGIISAIILLVVYFGMLLNQFIAGSSILSHISGMSYEMALIVSSSIIAIYLLAGGFQSVIKTDIFQYIVLFSLFVFLGFILIRDDHSFSHEMVDLSRMDPLMTIVFIAFGVLIIFQSAEYWQRVYAAKNSRVVKKGLILSAILVVLTGLVVSVVGLSAHLHVPGIESRNAFAEGLTILVPDHLIGAGLILLFAAVMSSADTIIFVLASSISKDYISQFKNQQLTDHKLMVYTRLFILLFSVMGFTFAYFLRDLVAVIIFITGIGFTVIPAAIATFHFKIEKQAAQASLVAGLVYILILIFTNNLIAELSIASIVVSAITLVIVQLVLKLNKR
ncbi:MAG: sodium:solute symporter family protein [Bacteroidales bacterium]|nr:sodium:solute symporter family protein [Bacteroidales bacterium]MCF8403425.1 sodium:solute symporter family protein [Bacteroidales bacterium]